MVFRSVSPWVLAVSVVLATSANADELILKSGTKIRDVTIVGVSYNSIKWKKGVASGEYLPSKVAKIQFADSPFEYEKGIQAFNEGRYEAAMASFKKCAARPANKIWVGQYSLWRVARCQILLGKVKEAGVTLEQLLTAHPNTRYRPDVLIRLGRINLMNGKTKDAISKFEELIKLAKDDEKGPGKYYFHLGRVWLGRAKLVTGKLADALDLFQSTRSNTQGNYKSVYLYATVGEGQVLSAQKQWDQARLLFKEAIDKAQRSNVSILAQAYNGLGETYYSPERGKNLQEALRNFLKVIVLFDSEDSEVPKALYYASRCFAKLKAMNKEYGLRAALLKSELRDNYPGSPWAHKK